MVVLSVGSCQPLCGGRSSVTSLLVTADPSLFLIRVFLRVGRPARPGCNKALGWWPPTATRESHGSSRHGWRNRLGKTVVRRGLEEVYLYISRWPRCPGR